MKLALITLFVLSLFLSAQAMKMKGCKKVLKKFPVGCPGRKCLPSRLASKICRCLPDCVVEPCKKGMPSGSRMEVDRLAGELDLVGEQAVHKQGKKPRRMRCVPAIEASPAP